MEEKRKSARKYLYSYSQVLESDSNRVAGRLVNITPEGMMLMSDRPFKKETRMRFTMVLPHGINITNDSSIELQGSCRWCKESYNPDYYDAGFEFDEIPEKSANTIEYLMRFHSFNY